jgi:hypothetical protein
MTTNLVITPKKYDLNISQDVLKDLRPYFQFSSRTSSFSHQEKKLVEGKWVQEGKKDAKEVVDIQLRDAVSGELIGKGHFECNPEAEKRDKYEEKIPLRTLGGQDIGSAIVEISKPKKERGALDFDKDMKQMRRALGGLMRHTNRLFRDFSRNYFDDELMGWGSHGLLDDWMRPGFMLEEGEDWFPQFRLQPESSSQQQALESQSGKEVGKESQAGKEKKDVQKEVSAETRKMEEKRDVKGQEKKDWEISSEKA